MANGEGRNLRHFFLRGHGEREDFTSPQAGGGRRRIPERNREQHARRLEGALTAAISAADQQIAARDAEIAGGTPGFYLEFDLPRAQQPLLDKLEDRRGAAHIELLSVRPAVEDPDRLISATVFVPEAKRDLYLRKVEDFRTADTRKGRPRNEPLVASIETAKLAQVRSLYTDEPALFPPDDQDTWWEVWVRAEALPVIERAAAALNIEVRDHTVSFPERDVILMRATPRLVGRVLANTDAIAELRLARDTPAVFMNMAARAQLEFAEDMADRLEPPAQDAPAVCILDSGTTRRHPLITLALDRADQQAWDATWSVEDIGQWRGHGTQMSGLALYGDLTPHLASQDPVVMTHHLESVKILPDRGANNPDLYGYITATAISRAEVQAPERPRTFCMAVTTHGDWRGRPTSWSAKLDDLAYGEGTDQRMIAVSGGNIPALYPAAEYLDQNDASQVENPAQAWNVLTVGAVTEKITITDPNFGGWQPLAPAGDLSPLSRTSVPWHDDWPIKPEVVFEGGNQGINPADNTADNLDDLLLLTTHHRLQERLFTVSGDTSAATAQVARLGAQILADRDELWPETVRGLIVHSAEWTPAMLSCLPANARQRDKRLLVRRYGYGVPDLSRAQRSLQSDVTIVIESEMRPFEQNGADVRTRDMVLHDLPWPIQTLQQLGAAQAEIRVTLSYFIEPNPGERGWTKRHRYMSHGLRFALKRAEEPLDDFRRRINAAARDDEGNVAGGGQDGWVLGPNLRNRGSIHSDIWQGSAADLASRHGVAVYPTGGWWREKPALQRADRVVRYALLVTVRVAEDVELYTEIENSIGVDVEIDA